MTPLLISCILSFASAPTLDSFTEFAEKIAPRITEGHVTGRQKAQFNKRLKEFPQIENILEIGLNAGHSAQNFFENCPNLKRFVSVDILWHDYTLDAIDFFKNRYQDRFQVIVGDSLEKIPEYASDHPDNKFDLIYLDGNHDYQYCLQDIINCRALAHDKTILWIDDFNIPVLCNAVNNCVSMGLIEIVAIYPSDEGGHERCWVEARYRL